MSLSCDDYELQEQIGKGSFGKVYKAQHRDGTIHAIKIIDLESQEDDMEDVQQEISMLQTCKCPQLTHYYGSFMVDSSLWIVMELLEGGSLQELMKEAQCTINEPTIAWIMRDMLQALVYLHSERKIHRDIKAANVLIARDGSVRVADFGVSVQLTVSVDKRRTFVGSPYWMAPEVIAHTDYNERADIWSLGITAIELATGLPPLSEMHPMKAVLFIPKNAPPRLPDDAAYGKKFQSFVERCLVKDPDERPSAAELLKHPFIKGAKQTNQLQELMESRRANKASSLMQDLFGSKRAPPGAANGHHQPHAGDAPTYASATALANASAELRTFSASNHNPYDPTSSAPSPPPGAPRPPLPVQISAWNFDTLTPAQRRLLPAAAASSSGAPQRPPFVPLPPPEPRRSSAAALFKPASPNSAAAAANAPPNGGLSGSQPGPRRASSNSPPRPLSLRRASETVMAAAATPQQQLSSARGLSKPGSPTQARRRGSFLDLLKGTADAGQDPDMSGRRDSLQNKLLRGLGFGAHSRRRTKEQGNESGEEAPQGDFSRRGLGDSMSGSPPTSSQHTVRTVTTDTDHTVRTVTTDTDVDEALSEYSGSGNGAASTGSPRHALEPVREDEDDPAAADADKGRYDGASNGGGSALALAAQRGSVTNGSAVALAKQRSGGGGGGGAADGSAAAALWPGTANGGSGGGAEAAAAAAAPAQRPSANGGSSSAQGEGEHGGSGGAADSPSRLSMHRRSSAAASPRLPASGLVRHEVEAFFAEEVAPPPPPSPELQKRKSPGSGGDAPRRASAVTFKKTPLITVPATVAPGDGKFPRRSSVSPHSPYRRASIIANRGGEAEERAADGFDCLSGAFHLHFTEALLALWEGTEDGTEAQSAVEELCLAFERLDLVEGSKRKKRLELNRKAAKESRERKKKRVEALNHNIVMLTRENYELRTHNDELRELIMSSGNQDDTDSIEQFQQENALLRLAVYECVENLANARHPGSAPLFLAPERVEATQPQQHMPMDEQGDESGMPMGGMGGMGMQMGGMGMQGYTGGHQDRQLQAAMAAAAAAADARAHQLS
ncbi:hypothetical protein JKP88DRAFT_335952 [Tribonema minus]|uniref:non-specific serine/threonine protein kinase n=1 Tax=Tribonema minus TaxID=303371 RepID=A0A836C7V6_9STRA|nr:hypothetical protein JKP88DRAFT_335952 [Tribonema minus]